MAKINLLNEKGNIRPKVRDSIKSQIGTLISKSVEFDMQNTQSAGTYVVKVGEVETTNEPVWATITVGVSTIHPDTKAKTSRKSSKTDNVELPELF
jgi:uncharacterized protein (UPF0218 family)